MVLHTKVTSMHRRPTLATSALAVLLLAFAADAGAQPFAYVVSARSDALSRGLQVLTVIDLATRRKVASIPLGDGCLCLFENAAVSSDGSRIYVSNFFSNTVSVFDTASQSVVRTLNVQTAPGSLAVSPDGTRLYVTIATPSEGFSVQVLDIESGSTVTTIPLEVPQSGSGIALTPDGTRLYVSNQAVGASNVKVIDTTINAVMATIDTPSVPRGVDVVPNGLFAYVAVQQANALAVISTATNTVAATVPVGTAPLNVRVLPSADRAYVSTSEHLAIVRTDTHTVTGTIPAVLPRAVDFTPDSSIGVLAADRHVYIFETATNALVGSIPFDVETDGNPNYVVIPQEVPPPPEAPTDFAATAVAGNLVTLQWQPPSSGPLPSAYVLEGGVNPGETLASIRTNSASPVATVSVPSGAFYVRVHALGAGGRSPASNEIRLFVGTATAPSAPASLLGLVNGDSVALSWRNTFEGGAPASLVLDVTGSLTLSLPLPLTESFTFSGVPPGTYTIAVRAVNAAGVSSPQSNTLTLMFPGACSGVPQAPTNFFAYREGNLITVRWDPPSAGAAPTGYVLNVSGPLVGSVPTTARMLSGTVPAGTYALSVVATNACGAGVGSPVQSIVVP